MDPVNTSPAATPETVAPAAPVVVETSPAPSAPPVTPQQSSRQDIYARYYTSTTPPTPGGQEPTPEPTAQVEPTIPVTNEPVASGVEANAKDTEISELKTRLAQLESALRQSPAQPKVETPVAPTTPAVQIPPADTSEAVMEQFLALLHAGDKAGAFKHLKAAMTPEIKVPDQQETVNKAVEQFKFETAIDTFLTDLRSKNADLTEDEGYISYQAQQYLAAVPKERMTTYADMLTEYKAAVTKALDDTRKRVQRYRVAGKEEAMVTRQQVISSSPLTPNPVTSHRDVPKTAAPTPESASDYLAKRQAAQWQRKGISS